MFTLDGIEPWGRSFDEYRSMFALSDMDLGLRILGCADGPASFNAVATRRGANVISCDPLYRLSAGEIEDRIAATYDKIMEQTRMNANQFVWNSISSVKELGELRMAAMTDFLGDYVAGKAQGRYLEAQLPELPFPESSFDLAICSHFLFLYGEQLGEKFHFAAVREMCRVATECRIFPLLELNGRRSELVEPVFNAVRSYGFEASLKEVPYEFQRGGNQMIRIRGPRLAAGSHRRGLDL
jgi:hypothetical protein